VVADAGERPALFVEPLCIVDLVVGEALPAHGDVVAVEDGADGAALDAELVGQFADGGTS
jgi:hypothetical protein